MKNKDRRAIAQLAATLLAGTNVQDLPKSNVDIALAVAEDMYRRSMSLK